MTVTDQLKPFPGARVYDRSCQNTVFPIYLAVRQRCANCSRSRLVALILQGAPLSSVGWNLQGMAATEAFLAFPEASASDGFRQNGLFPA